MRSRYFFSRHPGERIWMSSQRLPFAVWVGIGNWTYVEMESRRAGCGE